LHRSRFPIASALDALGFALRAHAARRARERGDLDAYRGHALDAIRRALAADCGASGAAALVDCLPVGRTRGGYFSCLVTRPDGLRRFVKCVPRRSREMRFWDAWERGEIRAEGQHYRLLPPERRILGRHLALLIFPDLGSSPGLSRRRTSRYAGNLETVVLAIADFNSDHLARDLCRLPVSRAGRGYFVPFKRRIMRALAVDRAEARRIARRLRGVEWRWPPLRRRVYRAPLCLSHMDFGPGNIFIGPEPAVILDFGHAAAAPIGSDLHTLLRYGRKGDAAVDWARLVEVYAGVFEAKGIAVDRAAIARAAEMHFAARYRNLRLESARDVFLEALERSRDLVADGRGGGILSFC
jgi:hypothetical protein